MRKKLKLKASENLVTAIKMTFLIRFWCVRFVPFLVFFFFCFFALQCMCIATKGPMNLYDKRASDAKNQRTDKLDKTKIMHTQPTKSDTSHQSSQNKPKNTIYCYCCEFICKFIGRQLLADCSSCWSIFKCKICSIVDETSGLHLAIEFCIQRSIWF